MIPDEKGDRLMCHEQEKKKARVASFWCEAGRSRQIREARRVTSVEDEWMMEVASSVRE